MRRSKNDIYKARNARAIAYLRRLCVRRISQNARIAAVRIALCVLRNLRWMDNCLKATAYVRVLLVFLLV